MVGKRKMELPVRLWISSAVDDTKPHQLIRWTNKQSIYNIQAPHKTFQNNIHFSYENLPFSEQWKTDLYNWFLAQWLNTSTRRL